MTKLEPSNLDVSKSFGAVLALVMGIMGILAMLLSLKSLVTSGALFLVGVLILMSIAIDLRERAIRKRDADAVKAEADKVV